ncbi:hypothetical protein OHS70_04705 [Streptomyces sp. NBC_00390]|uniref:class I SAM-dependent methyltransferase n=1 Tax=Streptomyces sp. NBC_00390 TaxID=2975736 RepID=UPI002E1F38A7
MERRDVRGHYEELAAEYDEHWVYGPDYIPWMSARIAEALRLTPADRIADIGSGTGLFAREVLNVLQPRHPILCVDPSSAMLRRLGTPPPDGLTPVVASAEDIAEQRCALPYEQLAAPAAARAPCCAPSLSTPRPAASASTSTSASNRRTNPSRSTRAVSSPRRWRPRTAPVPTTSFST